MALQTNLVSNNVLETMNPSKAKTSSDATSAADAQNRFMTLLVTQMKNQDPLNPMDNAQVTSQLAQLSTVTGIDKLNDTVKDLQASYQSSQSLQSAALIGHGVLTAGDGVTLDKSKAILGVDVTSPADSVKVTITNMSGQVMHTLDMGAQEIGTIPMTWDGSTDSGVVAPDGKYRIKVETILAGKKIDGAQPLQFGMVDSISTNAKGVKVNLGNAGSVDLQAVRQIL
jgi:flagellar basal-body rod modification protein FlgD